MGARLQVMKGKRVVLGVTGGIAAYKAAELARMLVRNGAETRVAMTKNATNFVTPLTFEALTGNRVVWNQFDSLNDPMDHISWGQDADIIIVAPATANFLAKTALGIADDFLSTMMVAATAPVLVCPAMNDRMLEHPAVRENLHVLRKRGVAVMEPGTGDLACGTVGPGRLPEPEDILDRALAVIAPKDLEGRTILITAGPTMEPMDPVRFISNRSSGKMGYALARIASRRGASVILVSGPTGLKPPSGVTFVDVRSAEEMRAAVLEHWTTCDAVIKAAAVADYRPREASGRKVKKGKDDRVLELVCNPDILAELGKEREDGACVLVGFAAETESLLENAQEKLQRKNVDMIVANDVSRPDAGFDVDTNLVNILHRGGDVETLSMMTKEEVADRILDRILELWKDGPPLKRS
ncbi:MAG: bifunctional phosphopantothenoylcysteine decarboxylase/phosphopantothenate--cysteine ligase CoaBC [Desulfatiglandales bacterium]